MVIGKIIVFVVVITKKQQIAVLVGHFGLTVAVHQNATISRQAMPTALTNSYGGVIALFGKKIFGWLRIHEFKKSTHDKTNQNDIDDKCQHKPS